MKDTIYRADAIKAVKDAYVMDAIYEVISEDIIKALSALPSADAKGDLISREEAIAIMTGALEQIEETEGIAIVDKVAYRTLEDYAEEAFSTATSADAVQGWIPVEEQPPEFPCLVCDANGNQPSVPLGIVTITDEEHGEWHIDGRLWDSPKVFVDGEWGSQLGYGNRIIAWMPLPTPYKGGEE